MDSIQETTAFGKPMKEHFLLDPKYLNINHGSFGTIPRQVFQARRQFQELAEANPDKYIRYTGIDFLTNSRTAAASVLNVPVDELVFVPNATNGINTVLRNLVFKPKDAIIHFDTAYGAIKKTILAVLEINPGLKDFAVDYVLPCSHEVIVENFLKVIKDVRSQGFNPKVAIFDTIVSTPGVRFPFESLTEECHKEGILSCIDGAHGIGQIKLDVGKLNADFFFTNAHKWYYAPRACALLHVPTRNHHLIRTTLPTSHSFEPLPQEGSENKTHNPLETNLVEGVDSHFTLLFQYIGTMDDTPYHCFPAAKDFRDRVCGGDDKIFNYLRELAAKGGDYVAKALGTEVMDETEPGSGEPSKLRDCAFASVRLPIKVISGPEDIVSAASSGEIVLAEDQVFPFCRSFEKLGLEEHGIVLPMYPYKGSIWTRLSAQIYLDEDDFKMVADAAKNLCSRVITDFLSI